MVVVYRNRVDNLRRRLQDLESAVVAFSGGVDSSVLVVLAHDLLAEKMVAATAVSPSLPDADRRSAVSVCLERGIPHRFVDTSEFDDPSFVSNPLDRCYHCKRHLYCRFISLADEMGFGFVVEGTNIQDLNGHRPGVRASRENPRVITPLIETGFSKEDVRRLAAELGLSTAKKPSSACLASRVPTGVLLTADLMGRIDAAEEILHGLGVVQVRVRHHGDLARIEADAADIMRCIEQRGEIAARLRELGWKFVTIDLVGYRTGGMRG